MNPSSDLFLSTSPNEPGSIFRHRSRRSAHRLRLSAAIHYSCPQAFGAITLSEHRLAPGDDDQALISRAGFFLLECQDVRQAVAELEKLSERSKAVYHSFIRLCRGRLALEQALDAIRAEVRLQEAQLL